MRRKMLSLLVAAFMGFVTAGFGLSAVTVSASEAYGKVYDFTEVTDVATVTDFSVGIDPSSNNSDLGYDSDSWVTYQKQMSDLYSADNGLKVKTEMYSGDEVSENRIYTRLNAKKLTYFKAELVYTRNSDARNGWAGFMFGYTNFDRQARWGDSPAGVEMFVQSEGRGTYASSVLSESNYVNGTLPESWQVTGEHTLGITVNGNGVQLYADGTMVSEISKETLAEKGYVFAEANIGFFFTNGDFTAKKFSYSVTDENGDARVPVEGIEVAESFTVKQFDALDLNAKVLPENATLKTLTCELPDGAVMQGNNLYFGKPGTYSVKIASVDVPEVNKTVSVTVTAEEALQNYGTDEASAKKAFDLYTVTNGGSKDGASADLSTLWEFNEDGSMKLKEKKGSAVDGGYSILYLNDLVSGSAVTVNCFEIDYMVKAVNAPNGWHGVGFCLGNRLTVPNQDGISVFIQEEARKATIWGSGIGGLGGVTEKDSSYTRGEWNFVRVKVYGSGKTYKIEMYVNDLSTPAVTQETTEDAGMSANDIALFTTTEISLKDVYFTRLDAQGNRIATVYPESVTIANKKTTAEVGGTYDIETVISPANVTVGGVLFESSDPLIATVTAEGKVSFRQAGRVTITVKCRGNGSVQDTVEIEIKKKEVKPTEITFDATPSAEKTVVGGKYTLFVTVYPANATDADVVFTSSDESVATVDADGRLSFLKAGKVTITVTAKADASVKNSIELTVTGGTTGGDQTPGGNETPVTGGGCGGSAVGASAVASCIAFAAAALLKRKK